MSDIRGSVVNSSATRNTMASAKSDKEKKIGHRRVGEDGEITYKKIQTSTIMGSIQLGIQHTVRINWPSNIDLLTPWLTCWTKDINTFLFPNRWEVWPQNPSEICWWWIFGKWKRYPFRRKDPAWHQHIIIANFDSKYTRQSPSVIFVIYLEFNRMTSW